MNKYYQHILWTKLQIWYLLCMAYKHLMPNIQHCTKQAPEMNKLDLMDVCELWHLTSSWINFVTTLMEKCDISTKLNDLFYQDFHQTWWNKTFLVKIPHLFTESDNPFGVSMNGRRRCSPSGASQATSGAFGQASKVTVGSLIIVCSPFAQAISKPHTYSTSCPCSKSHLQPRKS